MSETLSDVRERYVEKFDDVTWLWMCLSSLREDELLPAEIREWIEASPFFADRDPDA